MSSKKKIPYLTWRVRMCDDAHIPRFEPSPKLRRANIKGFNLMTDGTAFDAQDWAELGLQGGPDMITDEGRPMRPLEAQRAIEALSPFIDAAITAQQEPAPARAPRLTPSVDAMIADYLQTAEFKRLKPKTQMGYIYDLRPAAKHFEGRRPKSVLEPDIIELFEIMRERNGHSQAHHTFAALRIVFRWARVRSRRWRGHTPVLEWGGMKIEGVAPRVRVGTETEIQALIRAADDPAGIYQELGLAMPRKTRPMPSVADAIMLALWTAQRQGDVLHMMDIPQIRQEIKVRQGKSDRPGKVAKLVTIPVLPPLGERLAMIRRRKMKMGWSQRPQLVLTDVRGAPYNTRNGLNNTMSSYYARVRKIAALIEPSVISLNFQDLRDTAITRLGEAECDIWQIISWSGHSPQSAHKVIEHYMGVNASFARKAGEKLLKSLEV